MRLGVLYSLGGMSCWQSPKRLEAVVKNKINSRMDGYPTIAEIHFSQVQVLSAGLYLFVPKGTAKTHPEGEINESTRYNGLSRRASGYLV